MKMNLTFWYRHGYFSFILLIVLVVMEGSDSANILGIFPTPSYSHQQPMLGISLGLVKQGHNVTVITTDPTKLIMANYTEIDAKSAYGAWKKLEEDTNYNLQKQLSPYTTLSNFDNQFTYITRAVLENPNVAKFMRIVKETNTTYDLVMIETFRYPSLLGLVYQDNKKPPPIVGLMTVSLYPVIDVDIGNPLQMSYVPTLLSRSTNRMSFFERVENVILTWYTMYKVRTGVMVSQQKILNEYFGYDVPTVEEIERSRSLQIFATDLSTSFMRPLQPNTILIGQTHLSDLKLDLPQDLQKWMDEAEDGVIYFSLGSNLQGTNFPDSKRRAFIEAFAKLPKTRVLWKWESDEKLPGQPNNVLTRKWLPQKSVLAHPKVRLFISQVGLQSMQEAIHFSVPVLGIPMFGDQDYNAHKLKSEEGGIVMNFQEINSNMVYENLKSLLTDSKYKKNMLRLQKIASDKPMSSIDTAVWWIEYVLRHDGAPHLRSAALDLNWYQLHLVDVFAFFISIIAVVMFSIYIVIKKCFFPSKSVVVSKVKKN